MPRLPLRALPLLLLGAMCAATGEQAPPPPVTAQAPRSVPRDELGTLVRTPPGRVRFMTFWATWCGPCMSELPRIRAFAARHPEAQVVLVNVDVTAMHTTRVLPTLQSQRLEGVTNVLLKSDNPARDLAAVVPGWVDEIPFTLVQKADGTILTSRSVPLSEPELEQLLADASRP